jgi:XRE family transcriptional regulator, regulator of sulfur utilization
VREGMVEFTVNGNSFRVGPGSVGVATSNDLHGVRNPGDVPASYFVVAVEPGAAG